MECTSHSQHCFFSSQPSGSRYQQFFQHPTWSPSKTTKLFQHLLSFAPHFLPKFPNEEIRKMIKISFMYAWLGGKWLENLNNFYAFTDGNNENLFLVSVWCLIWPHNGMVSGAVNVSFSICLEPMFTFRQLYKMLEP